MMVNTVHAMVAMRGFAKYVRKTMRVRMCKTKVMPLNPYRGGVCRTIKAQYQQSSLANFIRDDGLAATGVIEIEDEEREDWRS